MSIQPQGPPDLKSSWSNLALIHHKCLAADNFQFIKSSRRRCQTDSKPMLQCWQTRACLRATRAACLSSNLVLPRAQPPAQQKEPVPLPRVETPTRQHRDLTTHCINPTQRNSIMRSPTRGKGSPRLPLAPDPPCCAARSSSKVGLGPGNGR